MLRTWPLEARGIHREAPSVARQQVGRRELVTGDMGLDGGRGGLAE